MFSTEVHYELRTQLAVIQAPTSFFSPKLLLRRQFVSPVDNLTDFILSAFRNIIANYLEPIHVA